MFLILRCDNSSGLFPSFIRSVFMRIAFKGALCKLFHFVAVEATARHRNTPCHISYI